MASRRPIYTFRLTGYATESNEKNMFAVLNYCILYSMFCSFVRVSYDSVVPLGWVGLGWIEIFKFQLGWVGLGQPVNGLGWIGSHKMDPWTTLWRALHADPSTPHDVQVDGPRHTHVDTDLCRSTFRRRYTSGKLCLFRSETDVR